MVGLLSEIFLSKEKGATIVHDPRLIWNTIDVVEKHNGRSKVTKTGHAFCKSCNAKKSGAIYGGEVSAHHYFKDFYYCDSGMIPWLLIWQLLSTKNQPICDLISERQNRFPSSGELNFTVSDADKCIKRVKDIFISDATSVEELDGLDVFWGLAFQSPKIQY